MTGMESMINNAVKSISGLSIDEIKAQAGEAQKKVLEIISTMNANFAQLAVDNKVIHAAVLEQSTHLMKGLSDLAGALALQHEDHISRIESFEAHVMKRLNGSKSAFILNVLDAIRADQAQLLRHAGIELSDDLVSLLADRAGPGGVVIAGKLPAWDGGPENGVVLPNPSQPIPVELDSSPGAD